MTRLIVNPQHLNRDEFLTPFDKIFDQMMSIQTQLFIDEKKIVYQYGLTTKKMVI